MSGSTVKIHQYSHYIYLLIIICIAAFLRLYHLTYQSLWFDELHSVVAANPANTISYIIEYCKRDQPPAFFLLLHYWFKLFPYNEFFARFFAALIGIGGVISMFFLGKELFNQKVGLLACFITALNWFHIYYSQEVRFYGLLFLLTIISYIYFIRSTRNPTFYNVALYIISSIGALYTHYYGMVVLMTQLLIFIGFAIAGRSERKTNFAAIIAGIIIIIGFIPWMPTILQDNTITEYWAGMPSLDFLVIYYFIYMGHNPFLIILYALFALIYFYKIWIYRKNDIIGENNKEAKMVFVLLAAWISLSYIIPLIYSSIQVPILHERYTIITLPAIFLVFAAGFSHIKTLLIRVLLILAIIYSTAYNFTYKTKYYTSYHKNQFREVVQRVMTISNTTKIYSDQAWHYNFYFDTYQSPIKAIDSFGINFKDALANEEQVWILQGLSTNGINSEQQQYINANFSVKNKFDFVGASATLYQRLPSTYVKN